MSRLKRFLLELLGQYFPETICKDMKAYEDKWTCYIKNRKGTSAIITNETFDRLLITGYYEEEKYHSGFIQYKLIKK